MSSHNGDELKRLLTKRELTLSGNVDNETQNLICDALVKLNGVSDKPITFFIDSYGGRMDACTTICDAISRSQAPVHGIATLNAVSGAFFILQACRRRLAKPDALLMYDSPTICERVDDEQFETKWRELLNNYRKQLKELSQRSNQPLNQLRRWGREEKMFSAKDAHSLGFIDELISLN